MLYPFTHDSPDFFLDLNLNSSILCMSVNEQLAQNLALAKLT